MVLEWGMSQRLGFVSYVGHDTREMFLPERDYSPETARIIDEEVRRLVDEAFHEAERLLETNWEKVVAVAEALLKYETLQKDEVERLMRGERLERPSVAEMLAAGPQRAASRTPPASTPGEPGQSGTDDLGGILPTPA